MTIALRVWCDVQLQKCTAFLSQVLKKQFVSKPQYRQIDQFVSLIRIINMSQPHKNNLKKKEILKA